MHIEETNNPTWEAVVGLKTDKPLRRAFMPYGGIKMILSAISFAAVFAASALPLERQEFSLGYGWNAIYVQLAPEKTPSEVFADWPVKSVGFYDPASFLATRQFSSEWDSEGLSMAPVAMWHRDYPEASDAKSIPSGSVCLMFSTNTAKTAVSIVGRPAAPRITWHRTDTNEVYNFIGFSLQKGASISPEDYFDGFLENVGKGGFYMLGGRNEQSSPNTTAIYSSMTVSDGDVLLVASGVQSDWSGVLNVSPMGGLDYGTDEVLQTLHVRNDGASARTVAIDIIDGIEERQLDLRRSWLHTRSADAALTNAVWASCVDGQTRLGERRLAPGETWSFQIGLDRKALVGYVRGLSFGGILRVTDVDGKTKMRVDVPIVAQTSGESGSGATWPAGLWVADVSFDSVQGPGEATASETGGRMKVRLPIHIDASGRARLLQRVVAAGAALSDGTYDYRLYAGSAVIPSTAKVAMRISAVCLPTEIPVVESQSGLSDKVVFSFTVSGGGATSLLRHPLHPRHDGLDWDFKTPAPSGDNLENYMHAKKPETFSVASKIELSFDMNGGEAAWNPEGVKSGSARWALSGLRHEGAITLSGPMSIQRVAPKPDLVLE